MAEQASGAAFPGVTVVGHPLVQHKLTLLRRKDTAPEAFRRLTHEIGLLMGCEALRDLALRDIGIETPLEAMDAPALAGPAPCFVSILRAGNGLLDGMLALIPSAVVGHVGLYRDAATLRPVEYYLKLPGDLAERVVVVVDPMLATGHSAVAALSRVREAGAVDVRFACLLAAPEGLETLARAHPEVRVFTAAIDRGLDGHGYIRPGLGDAGDRLFGTG